MKRLVVGYFKPIPLGLNQQGIDDLTDAPDVIRCA